MFCAHHKTLGTVAFRENGYPKGYHPVYYPGVRFWWDTEADALDAINDAITLDTSLSLEDFEVLTTTVA